MAFVDKVSSLLSKVFGSSNSRILKKYLKRLKETNDLESGFQSLTSEELKEKFNNLKVRAKAGESLDSLLIEAFAITREASKRTLGMRHFDVQIIGGMVLHEGKIAEMRTGEGKTLVATLAASLNALGGHQVHIVTVNDYLAQRDTETLKPLYEFLGYKVSSLTSDYKSDEARKEVYSADIIYGTNNEFGFDYLRDNMKYSKKEQCQKEHFYAIVDEVDSILIDEARTPLIISGPVNRQLENYKIADVVAKKLQKEEDFTIDEKNRIILLTDSGIKKAEELFKVDNLYSIENAALSHHLDQALKANYLFFKDKDYVVNQDGVTIVDEFTGRLSEGRRFSEGLHQALEAKENVEIKEESQTLADITFQNYFRLYDKLAGMTGTAQTEASEFLQIYNLEVVSIPTNVPIKRNDLNDLIYKSEKEKFQAVLEKVKELHSAGQPVLIGTASIEKSELLHELFKQNRIPHTVLNAKNHAQEAEIIKDAGKKAAVTIATNMAGRGVDIKLEDNVKDLGGLYIIGTERHESRRIDNQLRGRSGRQGDVGTSQFYLSLEDSLLRIFGSDRIKNIMEKLGLKDGEHIDSALVTRSVESAQKKVESMHFESRKHLLEYDDVANEQRKAIYNLRNNLLDENYDISKKLNEGRELSVAMLLDHLSLNAFELKEADYKAIIEALKANYNLDVEIEKIDGKTKDEIKKYAIAVLEKSFIDKMETLNEEVRKEIERILYLQVLDNLWREHLYTMDNLKTGIGLRGYNQKDPLVEYKKESYGLFMELVDNIKIEAFKALQIVEFNFDGNENENQRANDSINEVKTTMQNNNKNLIYSDNISYPLGVKKIARNELCPCGSGKKYKQCCGKGGPKKGLLANN